MTDDGFNNKYWCVRIFLEKEKDFLLNDERKNGEEDTVFRFDQSNNDIFF